MMEYAILQYSFRAYFQTPGEDFGGYILFDVSTLAFLGLALAKWLFRRERIRQIRMASRLSVHCVQMTEAR